ncbi:hypothetical protein GIB67_029620 [Kingdonia uniflora]|uniref:Uncharacterized protein n=1 Tax=Kingdonia uniflora TaxID=39325 RepID=A0A7J7LL97_9MAGN|nr:hypothetical protein GIB67_029620 [Kingdonia uniflora]
MMAGDLKVCVEVEKMEEDGWFGKESVCKAMKLVMDEESEIGLGVNTPNFPSSTFKIEESSSTRANVCSIHHDVEAVYYDPIESDDERNIDDEGNDNVNEVDEGNINDNDEEVQLGRHFLSQMDVVCKHCSALHWKDEQLLKSLIINPLIGQCCLQCKIKVPNLDALPNEFHELYDGNGPHSRSFRRYMREYNAASTFMSLGVHMDNRVAHG